MAIIKDLPGVKIEIAANGVALKEHQDTEIAEEERTVTRYIEAVSGQIFAVSIQLLPQFQFKGNCVFFQIYADGTWADGPVINKGEHGLVRLSEGKDTADGKVRRYQFANLERGNVSRRKVSLVLLLTSAQSATGRSDMAKHPK